MIELYHSPDTRSFRALWTLEEMGMQYQLHLLPFPPRVLAPEYLKVNPLGTIPLLIDGTVRLSESAAIVQYLVTRYGPSPLAVDASEADYGAWLNWLHFGEATLTFPQTLVLRYRRLEPGRAPMVADDYARWFLSRLKHVDRALVDRDWLCAGRFTGADISVGYALLLADFLGLLPGVAPSILAYWERIKSRDGFKAAKRAQKSELTDVLA
jgi:glutathione S-transferase